MVSLYYDPHQYRQINKKIQTTSTKCQYHAAASNPKWWDGESWWWIIRRREIRRKVEPIKTWRP